MCSGWIDASRMTSEYEMHDPTINLKWHISGEVLNLAITPLDGTKKLTSCIHSLTIIIIIINGIKQWKQAFITHQVVMMRLKVMEEKEGRLRSLAN